MIRIERDATRLQTIEDRFILVRASSLKDARKRLKWKKYAAPYLNSDHTSGRTMSEGFGIWPRTQKSRNLFLLFCVTSCTGRKPTTG